MEWIIGIIVLIVIFVLLGKSGQKKNADSKVDDIEDSPSIATIDYQQSTVGKPHYMFYAVVSELSGGFNSVSKKNAEVFPDVHQIAYTLFDKQRNIIEGIHFINLKNDHVPFSRLDGRPDSIDMLQEEAVEKVDGLREFAEACSKAKVFITHAAFHHQNILYAEYYKHDLALPFDKSVSIDLMEELKEWVDIPKDSGRGLKNPNFKECLAQALGTYDYKITKESFSSEEKVFVLPKIYFAWLDR